MGEYPRYRRAKMGMLRDQISGLSAVIQVAAVTAIKVGEAAREQGTDSIPLAPIDPRKAVVTAPRNASCPCGSGKKYKKCGRLNLCPPK